MANTVGRSELFAVNFAALAREIAMDVLPLDQILRLHELSDDDWVKVQQNPSFQAMLADLVKSWNSAGNTRERVKIKAASALEAQLEVYVADISDLSIPLAQRVEAGKFLARLGELDGNLGTAPGQAFAITLNIGAVHREVEVRPKLIEGIIPEE